MMVNGLALLLCLALLFATRLAAVGAARRRDWRRVRVLQFFRLGLALSACSYLLRLSAPASGFALVGSFLITLVGSLLIWIGGMESWSLSRGRPGGHPLPDREEDDGGVSEAASPSAVGLPRLNSHARRVLQHAGDEAHRQRQCRVDTDHLLLGLLQERSSASGDILARLDIRQGNIRLALGQAAVPNEPLAPSPVVETLPLTDRARQALSLAAQEAHRFEKASVGTDHLLLGLVLMGTGAAAAALFGEGVTVENVRGEVLRNLARRPR